MTKTMPDIDASVFRETLSHYPTGVAVITGVDAERGPVALVVGSFTSLSLDPPLVSFSPMRSSSTFQRLRDCRTFCVNVLASDQEDLCRQLAGPVADRLNGVALAAAPGGAPILEGSLAWIECAFESILDAGDHYLVIGRVTDLAVIRSCLPLLFFQGDYGRFSPPSPGRCQRA